MGEKVKIKCVYCNYEDDVELPEIPDKESDFRDDLDDGTRKKIVSHHWDTGREIGENNRHYGHGYYEVYSGEKLVGTIRWRWETLKFRPSLERMG